MSVPAAQLAVYHACQGENRSQGNLTLALAIPEGRASDYVASLTDLVDGSGEPCVTETMQGHNKTFKLTAEPVAVRSAASLADALAPEKS